MDLVTLDRRIADLLQEYSAEHRFEDQLFLPTREQLLDLSVRAATLLGSLPADPAPGAEAVLLGHFREQLEALLARLADDPAYPHRYIEGAHRPVLQLLYRDPRAPERRAEVLRRRLIQIPALLDAVLELLAGCGHDRREMAAAALRQGAALLEATAPRTSAAWAGEVRPVQLQNLESAFAAAAAAHREALDRLRSLPEAALPRQGLPYAEWLQRAFGLPVAELEARAGADVERLQAEIGRMAADLKPGATPAELLQAAPAGGSPSALVAELQELVARCRAVAAASVPLPPGESCSVELPPDPLQERYSPGGYAGPNIWAGGLQGTLYAGAGLQRLHRLWRHTLALRGSYPGLHTQFAWAAARPLPETFRYAARHGRSAAGISGAAWRAESRHAAVFAEPLLPLFATWRQLLAAVRLLADLTVGGRGGTLEEAADLYRRHAGLEPDLARAQAALHARERGIMALPRAGFCLYEKIQAGSGLDDAEFTRLILTHGLISPATAGRLAALSPGERAGVFRAWE